MKKDPRSTDQKRAQHPLDRANNEIARREVRKGLSPIEIMLELSRHYYEEWDADRGNEKLTRLLSSLAEKPAPYMHAKRASIQQDHNIKGQLSVVIQGDKNADV